jgi:uncharacterized protein
MRSGLYILAVGLAYIAMSSSCFAINGPSFDCSKAKDNAELAICADADLSRLDRRLARLFQMAISKQAQPRSLIADERRWVTERARCGERPFDQVKSCLMQSYTERMDDLAGIAQVRSKAFLALEDSREKLTETPWTTYAPPPSSTQHSDAQRDQPNGTVATGAAASQELGLFTIAPVGNGVVESSKKGSRPINEPVAIEFRGAEVIKSGYSAEIRMEFLGKYQIVYPGVFVRVICDVFDDRDQEIGEFSRDYTTHGGVLMPDQYWHPIMQIEFNEKSDHASCRFANKDDPLPTVSVDDIELNLVTTHQVSTTNLSPYVVDTVDITCKGQNISTYYTNRHTNGIVPDETTPPEYIKNYAEHCFVTAVTAKPAPDMSARW